MWWCSVLFFEERGGLVERIATLPFLLVSGAGEGGDNYGGISRGRDAIMIAIGGRVVTLIGATVRISARCVSRKARGK
jgi:hypothetical protein